MALMSVGPRAGKEEFMRALGLVPGDSRCEGVYRNMREEAIQVYNEINGDRSNLKDEQQRDPKIQNPFFWHHIREDRREAAIRRTWQNAAPGTPQRHYFNLGQTSGDHGPNWVTLWLLYSVFRSRDIRNNRSRRAGDTNEPSPVPDVKPPDPEQAQAKPPDSRKIFDPARNSIFSKPVIVSMCTPDISKLSLGFDPGNMRGIWDTRS